MTTAPPDAPTTSAPQGPTRLPPPGVVPTLTEVIDWPAAAALSLPADGNGNVVGMFASQPAPAVVSASVPAPAPTPAPAARLDDEEIVDNVLAAVQAALAEADGPLDQRLRDILEPALARFAEALVADVRADFAAALRDVAAEAVVQELGRYRRG